MDHFTIVISNTDNAVSKTYLPGEDGCIVITITEDEPLFSGDFTVLGYASDHVGNESRICYGTTEFALESSVKRILAGLQMRRKRNSYLYHMGICGPGGSHFPGMYDSTGSDIE